VNLTTISDPAAERAVIGAILAENSCYFRIDLKDTEFFSDSNRLIYRVIGEMLSKNKIVDMLTLCGNLEDNGKMGDAGGVSAVSSIGDDLPNPSAVSHYAEIVRNCAIRRNIQTLGAKAIQLANNASADEALDTTQRLLSDIASNRSGEHLPEWAECVDDLLNDIIRRAKSSNRKLRTGLDGLDRILHGFHDGEMVIAAARPGVGKTALCADVAVRACIEGRRVVMFSAEMTRESIVGRVLAHQAKVDNWRVQSAQVTDEEIRDLVRAADETRGYKLWIDARSRDAMKIRSRCRQLDLMGGIDLIIVDYLQRIRPHVRVGSREQEVAVVSSGLKDIATDMGLPMLVACQLNRSIEHRQDQKPALSDLRESGAIEQDADTVIGLSTTDDGEARIVTANVLKQRNGPLGECKLVYLPKWNQFKDYKDDAQ
jgi:replicative DNA helicase